MPPSEQDHCDPEQLALRALGEPADLDTDHLDSCARCRRELDELRVTVGVARSSSRADAPQAPPPAVWDRVVDELGVSPLTAATGAERPAGHAAGEADVVPLGPRRRRPPLLAAAAAAAVAGVLAGGTATWLALRPDVPDVAAAPAVVVASADLKPLPDWRASGDARVVRSDGQRHLHVDLRAPAPGPGDFREVWLLDRAAKRLVSLGLLPGRSGDFLLPPGLDLAAYPVVDVSEEPDDGNPAHSGDSIVRGTLDA